ncbi:MAG: hypothetical protein QHG98_09770, partial [Methanothrix sp.]|nr:hypothetical protein [Methanothrix sp.]
MNEENSNIEAKLSRIDERTMYIKKMLDSLYSTLQEHDRRLDSLEHWQSKITGAILLISFLFG